ncbi:MAG: response regulator [Acidobacteriaceae bacterium]
MMLVAKLKFLVVDDDISLRKSLSAILKRFGHSVRSAEDGFSALVEVQNEIPDIILSDLNMPGMSGFELLSVVRRRFPAIRVIAMSGAFSGDSVPSGVLADAFYDKGAGVASLLHIVEAMTRFEPPLSSERANRLAPVWVPKNGHDPSGEEYVVLGCPECLRTFPQVVDGPTQTIRETDCVHCASLIRYAVVQPVDLPPPLAKKQPCIVAHHALSELRFANQE